MTIFSTCGMELRWVWQGGLLPLRWNWFRWELLGLNNHIHPLCISLFTATLTMRSRTALATYLTLSFLCIGWCKWCSDGMLFLLKLIECLLLLIFQIRKCFVAVLCDSIWGCCFIVSVYIYVSLFVSWMICCNMWNSDSRPHVLQHQSLFVRVITCNYHDADVQMFYILFEHFAIWTLRWYINNWIIVN